MKVVGKQYEAVETFEYEVELVKTDGCTVRLYAIGLDSITEEAPGGDLEIVYSRFPQVPVHKI